MWPLLVSLAFTAPLVTLPDDPRPTLIHDVAVFDSETQALIGTRDVTLRGGKIAAMDPAGDSQRAVAMLAEGGELIDGSGLTLVPGLIDVHTHLSGTLSVPGRLRLPKPVQTLDMQLYAGVTTVLDLSTPIPTIRRWRKRIAHAHLDGPQIYASGKPFTAPGGHPGAAVTDIYRGPLAHYESKHIAWFVETNDDVDSAMAAEGPRDFIKVVIDAIPADATTLSAACQQRIAFAAEAFGVPVIAHVGRPEDVDAALAMHVSALAHAPYGGRLSDGQIKRIVDEGVAVTPTLAVWEMGEELGTGQAKTLWPEVLTKRQERDMSQPMVDAPEAPELRLWLDQLAVHHAERVGNVERLHDAGATILVGSDSPFVALAAGVGLHEELRQLVDAGLTPAEALGAATWTNSRFLEPEGKFGAIRPGWQADLLLIQGDPTDDIDAIDHIFGVWVDGRHAERTAR